MKVLVVGGGGREHALAWKISKSKKVSKIYVAPGNGGTAEFCQNVNIKDSSIEELLEFALSEKIDLTVVGPELPLCLGIVDLFREKGLSIIGPDKNASRLEGSKVFSKEFCTKYNIPTAGYEVFDSFDKAKAYVMNKEIPLVLKADGLAGGKGVIIPESLDEAVEALDQILNQKCFGSAGDKVIVEEFIKGIETSVICFIDKSSILPMTSAKDYKRALDGDKGLNTGGMGCISPNPILTDEIMKRINDQILKPLHAGVIAEGFDYRGIIYVGVMLKDGNPYVLEYNTRFGDPETQVLMPRLQNDLVDIFDKVLNNSLYSAKIVWGDYHCATVILASQGYPGKYDVGHSIGIEPVEGTLTFHSGTLLLEESLLTNGGRVMAVTALGKDAKEALNIAYKGVDGVSFSGKSYRTDIGS